MHVPIPFLLDTKDSTILEMKNELDDFSTSLFSKLLVGDAHKGGVVEAVCICDYGDCSPDCVPLEKAVDHYKNCSLRLQECPRCRVCGIFIQKHTNWLMSMKDAIRCDNLRSLLMERRRKNYLASLQFLEQTMGSGIETGEHLTHRIPMVPR